MVYTTILSLYYFFLFYMFSAGPVTSTLTQMIYVSYTSLGMSISSIVISIFGTIFKFRLTSLIRQLVSSQPSEWLFHTYFFVKLIYLIASFIVCCYLFAAFLMRYLIEYIDMADKQVPFRDGRREMSTKSAVLTNMLLNWIALLCVGFHILQNFHWLRLLSTSWEDIKMKGEISRQAPGDPNENPSEADGVGEAIASLVG